MCAIEMPRYQCHKKVWALKIKDIKINEDTTATIQFEGDVYAGLTTKSPGWDVLFKGNQDDLGYYVNYEDGHISWSPTKAFEKGYTRIEG